MHFTFKEYVVHFTNDTNLPADQWNRVTVPGAETQIELKDLLPNTDYHFRLQAVNERGPGVLTDPAFTIKSGMVKGSFEIFHKKTRIFV